MSSKPLDFEPGDTQAVIHSAIEPIKRRTLEYDAEYCREKIAELVMTQHELRRVTMERDALKTCLDGIASWNEGPEVTGSFDEPAAARKARAILTKLESGELRKP